jgi:hypothetical protein
MARQPFPNTSPGETDKSKRRRKRIVFLRLFLRPDNQRAARQLIQIQPLTSKKKRAGVLLKRPESINGHFANFIKSGLLPLASKKDAASVFLKVPYLDA